VFSRPVPRVFVVDDQLVIASSLAAILNRNGFSAEFFACPVEALEAAAAAHSESPDLVITDVAMPGMNGIDFGIQMRGMFPACEILLFSGQAATTNLLEGARNQGHHFHLLQKPVHPTDLLFEIGMLGKTKMPAATAEDTIARFKMESVDSTSMEELRRHARDWSCSVRTLSEIEKDGVSA
jgi:CheY-like chemotaxis protein